MYASISRAFRREYHIETTPSAANGEAPRDLTGKVRLDKKEHEFSGSYSYVYKGTYKRKMVAVKILQLMGKPESMKRKLKREAAIWSAVNHPNIQPFHGFIDDPTIGPFGALVSPWCVNGDAGQYIKEKGKEMLQRDRLHLWKGVIEGIAYLHGHRPTIVHGDLKPGNILIDDTGAPRICDFGLARIMLEEGHSDMTTTSEYTGTARYLSPELVTSDQTVYPTPESDVYALGCLGLEIICLQKPFSRLVNNMRGQIYMALRKALPPANAGQIDWYSRGIWPLFLECWSRNPAERPSCTTLLFKTNMVTFGIPPSIMGIICRSIAENVDPRVSIGASEKDWAERCRLLSNLCLVSKTFNSLATPLLYQDIRVYPDFPHRIIYALLETLDASQKRAANPPYASHTRTFIHVMRDVNSLRSLNDLSQPTGDLIQRLPNLHLLVFASRSHSILPHEKRDSLTILLESWGIELFCSSSVLHGLRSLQRLSICGPYDPHYVPLGVLYLPNLCDISIHAQNNDYIGLRKLLENATHWKLPSLESLDIDLPAYSGNNTAFISRFMREHGLHLHHLSLRFGFTPKTIVTQGILSSCGNLRSLNLSFPTLNILRKLDRLPTLSHLETIHLSGDLAKPKLERIILFKWKTRSLFPNLKKAVLGWTYIESIQTVEGRDHDRVIAYASFSPKSELITVTDGKQITERHITESEEEATALKAISDLKWDKLRAAVAFLHYCFSVAFNKGHFFMDIGQLIIVTVVSTVSLMVMIIASVFGEILVRLGIVRVRTVGSKSE